MMRNKIRASIAAALVMTLSVAAEAQPATTPLDIGRFDRCSTSTDTVGLLARQLGYLTVDGFDSRACPPIHDTSMPEDLRAGDAHREKRAPILRAFTGAIYMDDTLPSNPVMLGLAHAVSPMIFVSGGAPSGRWRVSASYGTDIVFLADKDVPKNTFRSGSPEARYLGTFAAEATFGPVRLSADGGIASEIGYTTRTVGGSVSIGLYDGLITPVLAYHAGIDRESFRDARLEHLIDVGASIPVGSNTTLVFAGTASSEPSIISRKISRQRFALLGRMDHRFDAATLRVGQRLYLDSWGLPASTTDARSFLDITSELQLGLHARLHIQGGAEKWESKSVTKPTLGVSFEQGARSDDLLIRPFFAATTGGGFHLTLSDSFFVHLTAEGIYSHPLGADREESRWGLSSTAAVELRAQ